MILYAWPTCTWVGCDCKRTWRTEKAARNAYDRHPTWVLPKGEAICFCHGMLGGATFPCDKTEKLVTYGPR